MPLSPDSDAEFAKLIDRVKVLERIIREKPSASRTCCPQLYTFQKCYIHFIP